MKQNLPCLPLHYFPCVAFVSVVYHHASFVLNDLDHFRKQSYRNRMQILGPNKVQTLSIPIQHPNRNIPIKEVRIDHSQKWQLNHFRAIQSAYSKAPYFDYYWPEFEALIVKKKEFLWDYTLPLLHKLLGFLIGETSVNLASDHYNSIKNGHFDSKELVPAKQMPLFFKEYGYFQLFGKVFAPNLSSIDLLFCEGPHAKAILAQSFDQQLFDEFLG